MQGTRVGSLVREDTTSFWFSCSVVSDSLRSHGLQYTRPPCPSPPPGAHSNSCPSSQGCHPIIPSSVVPLSCLQSFPASGSFPKSQFFASDGQSIGASASASVHPMNIQDSFPLRLTGLILQSKRLSRVFSSNHSLKASVLHCSVFFMVQPSHLYTTTGKTTVLTIQTFVVKVMSLLFNTLYRSVIVFLPRSKHLLIS